MLLDTTIKTSNGSGNTLLITPSAVTGLFTSTKLSSTVTTAKADIGVKVCVQVVGGRVLPNETPNATDTSCVVYDQRFQQISNTLFTNVAICAAGNAGTACTSDADCSGGTVCGPSDPTGTQTCTCGFDLTLSTLSAHSYNFIAQVPGDNKPHHVRATWKLTGVNQTLGSSNVAACVGGRPTSPLLKRRSSTTAARRSRSESCPRAREPSFKGRGSRPKGTAEGNRQVAVPLELERSLQVLN